jgi:hypothetical protein
MHCVSTYTHFLKINYHSYIVTDSNFPPNLTVVGEIGRQGGSLSVAEFRIFISKVKNENRDENFVRHGQSSSVLSTFSALTALTSQDSIVSLPHWQLACNPSMVRYDVILIEI